MEFHLLIATHVASYSEVTREQVANNRKTVVPQQSRMQSRNGVRDHQLLNE
jgi:hypothetical protein